VLRTLLLQSVVTYTAVGPTSNGKAVLANCQVRFELHSYTCNVACLSEGVIALRQHPCLAILHFLS
jgi:hypothetical protein